jgi:hypothetical protein
MSEVVIFLWPGSNLLVRATISFMGRPKDTICCKLPNCSPSFEVAKVETLFHIRLQSILRSDSGKLKQKIARCALLASIKCFAVSERQLESKPIHPRLGKDIRSIKMEKASGGYIAMLSFRNHSPTDCRASRTDVGRLSDAD